MTNGDVGQAIWEEIRRGGRNDKVEERLSSLESRLVALETRLDGVEGRLGAPERRFDSHEIRLDRLEKRFAVIEGAGAELNVELRSWPDIHYLAAAAELQMNRLRAMKTDVLDVEGRIGEVFQTMATPPEIQMLRDEVAGFRDQSLEFEVRPGALEPRMGIRAAPPTP